MGELPLYIHIASFELQIVSYTGVLVRSFSLNLSCNVSTHIQCKIKQAREMRYMNLLPSQHNLPTSGRPSPEITIH